MINQEKLRFLEKEFIPLIRSIPQNSTPKWGKMNLQQMVEHVTDFFGLSTDKIHMGFVTPVEHLPKYREFLMSEKEFRENTKAPVLPEEPFPIRNASLDEAIIDLEKEVTEFINSYNTQAGKKAIHPVFGELNFEEWVQLHHKHVKHHLKQFGII